MKKPISCLSCLSLVILILFISKGVSGQTLKEIEARRIFLPNGWDITAVGKSLALGDLPLNIAVSPTKKMFAVTNNGVSLQTVQLFDAVNEKLLDSVVMAKSWLGLTFSSDGNYLYVSGGNDNIIVRFEIKDKKLVPSDTIVLGKPWPEKISVAGIATDEGKKLLYAVTKEDNSLYVADLATRKVLNKFPLGGEGYTCILSPDKATLYISCWGCSRILMFDTGKMKFSGSLPVGNHPNDMCITANGRYLFVANANENSVSVADLSRGVIIEVLNSSLFPGSPAGSTTNSVALSQDEKTLYIANADNNCLAVFDVSAPGSSKSKGFIPSGWYPTCVRVINKKLLVSNGKGFSSMANPDGPSPVVNEVEYQHSGKKNIKKEQYIGSLFTGTLSIINQPDKKQLAVYSHAVYANTPYNRQKDYISEGEDGNPIPRKVGDPSPIKHVFYIIKENRTYDQVLGDMKEGNGDTSLVLFGEKITPNHHAVAREFVLLDNFYVNGEVSADGHNWSLGAYATDYLEKTWPTSYGGRGGNYDAEGNREIANNMNGFIWDYCKKYGVSYRTYGEFADDYKPNIPVLKDHFCPYFTSWDQTVRDTVRFNQWKHEFDSLVKAESLPQLNTLRFINDHTEGMTKGRPTPFVHVADNDLAVGLFIDYLSHSSVWKESVVFFVEDDAQNGPDHVDAHRSVALVAGGFVRNGFVDHTMYSTTSILRTIELILGLPPMSQYDASATPMWRCFDNTAGHAPYSYRKCNVDLNLKNSAENKWSIISETLDFSREDRAPDDTFNRIIWAAVKGDNIAYPAPRRAAFFMQDESDK
ncbi:MAG: bifunctional YncE family protein/alkaline phosphatase family protein [Bacteroidales bacterium]